MMNREEERKALWDSCPEPPAAGTAPATSSDVAGTEPPRAPLDWTQNTPAPPNATPQVFHPWRRYLARMLDFNLYSLIWFTFLGLVLHVNLMNLSPLATILNNFVALLIMLLVEPLLLQCLGTTPGKALFGLRVTWADGSRLIHREAQARTLRVIGAGMGYGIPFYNLYRNWKSYQLCSTQMVQPWDEGISYTIRDVKPLRSVAFVGASLALIFLNVALNLSQQLAPNRGDLTVAEFSKNYQYYVNYLEVNLGARHLDQDGQWVDAPRDPSTFYIDWAGREPPAYDYIVEDGVLTGVSFEVELQDISDPLSSYDNDMGLITLAFLGAQKEVGVFSSDLTSALKTIMEEPFGNLHFTVGGVTISCETTYTGFELPVSQFLFPKEGVTSNYFRQVFTIQK